MNGAGLDLWDSKATQKKKNQIVKVLFLRQKKCDDEIEFFNEKPVASTPDPRNSVNSVNSTRKTYSQQQQQQQQQQQKTR